MKTQKRIAGTEAERSFLAEAQHRIETRAKIKATSRMVGGGTFYALIVMKDNESEYPAKYKIRGR
jgi:hypothetical protein